MANRNKGIRERAAKINNAWKQGADTVTFNGVTRAGFDTEIKGAEADDQEITDMEAQVKLKKNARDDRWNRIGDTTIKIRDGVEGHPDFGGDHPIIEAMGFVRTSERKSGLTRKKDQPPTS